MSEPIDICLWIDAFYMIPQLTKLNAAFIRVSASNNNKIGRVGEFQLLSSVFSCRIMLNWSIIWVNTAREYNKAPFWEWNMAAWELHPRLGLERLYRVNYARA